MNMQLHLQQVPARNGRLWIRHGFKVFQRAPLALWRNKAAFALNALLWGGLLLAVAGIVSLGFGLIGLTQLAPMVLMASGLLLSTVFYASLYFSFVDCFMFGAPSDVLSD